ncbi:MAG: hypothetical protein OES38_19075, partial [Gammaproteobacteria bacterium]|nr:hypothetical protein [Gammaproteobacteria bacterium]
MKRFFAWFLGVLLGVVLLLAGTAFWLAATDAGSDRLLRVAEYLLDGALTAGATTGRIGERFCVDTATIVTDAVEVSARQFCVGVDLSRLAFEDELRFKVVSARELTINTTAAESDPGGELFPIEFALPLDVVVLQLAIDDLRVDDTAVSTIRLAGSASQRSILLRTAEAVWMGYQVTLRGDFGWGGTGNADLSFNVTGNEVDADGSVRGSLRALAWNLIGRQPVAVVASGHADLLNESLPYDLEVLGERIDVTRWADRPMAIGGVLTGSGDLQGYRFGFRGDIEDEEYGALAVATTGTGDWDSAHGELSASRGAGRASGTARVGWRPELTFAASLTLQDIDVANDFTELRVSGDLGVSGSSAEIEGGLSGLRGVVNDVAFAGGGDFRWSSEQLLITDLRLSVGEGRLSGR